MGQLTGRAEFFINGTKMGTVAGGTLKYGGEVRESVNGQFDLLGFKVTGFAPGGATLEIAHKAGLKARDFDVTDATIMIALDSGPVFLVNNASRIGDPPEIDFESSTISLDFEGEAAVEF